MKKESNIQENLSIIENSCSSFNVPFSFESPYFDCKSNYFVISHLGNYHFLYTLEEFISRFVKLGNLKCFDKIVITNLIH